MAMKNLENVTPDATGRSGRRPTWAILFGTAVALAVVAAIVLATNEDSDRLETQIAAESDAPAGDTDPQGADIEGDTPGETVVSTEALTAERGPGTLVLQHSADCRNSGSVQIGDTVWNLAEPVPVSWLGTSEVAGVVAAVDNGSAVFAAEDGTELRVVLGTVETECIGWQED